MDKCVNEKLGKQKVTTMFLSTIEIEIFNFKLILIELCSDSFGYLQYG